MLFILKFVTALLVQDSERINNLLRKDINCVEAATGKGKSSS